MSKKMKAPENKILSVITAATGDAVSIGEIELNHALEKHFRIPKIKLLEIVEQVLIDPTAVYLEEPTGESKVKSYHLFYKLEDGGYLVVVVKLLAEGAFFSSVYPTGPKIRPSDSKLRKIR